MHPSTQNNEYYSMMKSNTNLVFDFIKDLMKQIVHEIPASEEAFFSFLIKYQEKRFGTVWLRPTTLWLFYKASGGQGTPKEILPAMASVELLNSSTYLFNSVLDEKLGYTSQERIKDAIITGNIYREVAQIAMERQWCDEKTKRIILQRISTINLAIYQGQYVDLRALHQKQDEETIRSLLKARYAGFSGAFYGFVPELGAILSGASIRERSTVQEFGRLYGETLQIVNDMGDCVPPTNETGHKEKPYKDTLSDLRNGRVSLPIWLALRHPKCNHSLINKAEVREQSLEQIYDLAKQIGEHLVDLGVFSEIEREIRQRLETMNGLLDTLPKTQWRDFIKSQTKLIMLKNKWFKSLKKDYQ
ncbi:MAG: polyprenyl synthetase family protein [Candidatus Moranbacteria bacterium]|nr:polyprenyl synthetase family protein [Candidatus Moranbacteria bacterium]